MKDIAIFGAGGFGREVACLIHLINKDKPTWNFIGFFDDDITLKGTHNEYGEVLGGHEELNDWPKPLDVVIAIGNPLVVRKVAEGFKNPNLDYPNVIAPSVTFLDRDNVRLGKGNILCTNCMVSCNVTIGDFNLFNGYIPIGHDTVIGNYNVVMPSVNISGGVRMGDCNFFGVQSVVLQYLKIGNNTRVGANSVIMRNTKDGFLYMGNPAKKMEI
jgi:sugar O-acyltransferase (sialic acid O-acetyltransferase NeuD family)